MSERLGRNDFPDGFVFGAGSSAFQVEGATKEDGRGVSIWDKYAEQVLSDLGGGETKTSDQYHKYKEDVQLMVDTGLDAYRLSIAWSRLIPDGRGPINPKGLEYYNNLFDEFTANGIEPHVTLYHNDHPQFLEDAYGGWLGSRMVEDFTAYADACFHHFGDRVKHWTTVNEPNIYIIVGYVFGAAPPQRCSKSCTRGNSSTEPYLAGHNMLLAHAAAVKLYKGKYQRKQKGLIGFNLMGFNLYPRTSSKDDLLAVPRASDFLYGWFMDPLTYGEYPSSMRETVGRRLPKFKSDEAEMVKGSYDFIGLNHYYSLPVGDGHGNGNRSSDEWDNDYLADMGLDVNLAPGGFFDKHSPGPEDTPIEPWSLQQLLHHFKVTYSNPPMYVHENGLLTRRNVSISNALNDKKRVEYMKGFIGGVLDAIRNGSDTRGYFVWSFLDMFELLAGYQGSYGLYYIDFNDPRLTRYPKLSAHWYSNFLKGGTGSIFKLRSHQHAQC